MPDPQSRRVLLHPSPPPLRHPPPQPFVLGKGAALRRREVPFVPAYVQADREVKALLKPQPPWGRLRN